MHHCVISIIVLIDEHLLMLAVNFGEKSFENNFSQTFWNFASLVLEGKITSPMM